jgi:hypothetical protein
VDSNLLEELASRNITTTYMESKFYLYAGNAQNITYRDLADMAFMSMLALYVLYQEPHTRKAAADYAENTIRWDMTAKFKPHRINATDLYITMQGITDYENSMIAGKLKHTPEEATIRGRFIPRIITPDLRRLLVDMKSYQLSTKDTWLSRFFFKLGQALYIEDSSMLNLRRKVVSWHILTKSEKIYVIARLNNWFNTHAKRYDLRVMLNELARARDIE